MAASGIDDSKQQRALLLHFAGPGVREIVLHTTPEETKGDAKDYEKSMNSLNDYYWVAMGNPVLKWGWFFFLSSLERNCNSCAILPV